MTTRTNAHHRDTLARLGHLARPGATRAPWGWAAGSAVLGCLLAVVAFAPARWLAGWVQTASAGQVQLAQPRGSVWQGSAQLVLSGGAGSNDAMALPGRLNWRLQLRWPGLQLQLLADCCTAQALDFSATPGGWGRWRLALADSQSQWPAGLLAGLGTPWNTVAPQGQLVASSRGWAATWADGRVSLAGELQLDALQMSSRLSTLVPMGSYRLALRGGDTPRLKLQTLEGALQLSGEGQWVGQRLRFTGEASAAPERVEALSNLLNIIGRRNGARTIIKVG